MSRFEQIYSRLSEPLGASPTLKPLLQRLYETTGRRPFDLQTVRGAMLDVLEFLATPEGRTDANCSAVDRFLCLDDDWEHDWGDLPNPLHDILFDMGSCLGDTVTAPETAANFDSLPEQLLDRTRRAVV